MLPLASWIGHVRPERLWQIGSWTLRALGVLLCTILLTRVMTRIGRWSDALFLRARAALERRGRGISIRSVELLGVEAIAQLTQTLLSTGRVLASLTAIYLWVLAVAALVGQGDNVVHYFVTPLGNALGSLFTQVVGYIPNLVSLAVVVAVVRFVTHTVARVADAVALGRLKLEWLHADLARPTERLVILVLWLLGTVMAYPYLPGSDSKAFQGMAVFFGVLLSLGSSSVVGNALAGLVLTYSRAYRSDDRVKIGDTVGDVVELGVFNTRIRTTKDEEIVLPNAVVMNGSIVNYSRYAREGGVQISTSVTIGYDAPWRKVHALLLEAASKTPGLLANPKPYVLQTALNDFYVAYELRGYCDRPTELHLVSSALNERVQDSFAHGGIEICSPHFTSFRDGNKSTIPDPASIPADP
jgi:small-conductance mechanosensitive channel